MSGGGERWWRAVGVSGGNERVVGSKGEQRWCRRGHLDAKVGCPSFSRCGGRAASRFSRRHAHAPRACRRENRGVARAKARENEGHPSPRQWTAMLDRRSSRRDLIFRSRARRLRLHQPSKGAYTRTPTAQPVPADRCCRLSTCLRRRAEFLNQRVAFGMLCGRGGAWLLQMLVGCSLLALVI